MRNTPFSWHSRNSGPSWPSGHSWHSWPSWLSGPSWPSGHSGPSRHSWHSRNSGHSCPSGAGLLAVLAYSSSSSAYSSSSISNSSNSAVCNSAIYYRIYRALWACLRMNHRRTKQILHLVPSKNIFICFCYISLPLPKICYQRGTGTHTLHHIKSFCNDIGVCDQVKNMFWLS